MGSRIAPPIARLGLALGVFFVVARCGGAPEAGPLPADAFDPDDWELVELDLDLEIRPTEARALGHGRFVFRAAEERSDELVLVLHEALRFRSVRLAGASGGTDVGGADGGDLGFTVEGEDERRFVDVDLGRPRAEGERVTIDVEWESVGAANQFVVAENVALGSWVQGWYPVAYARELPPSRLVGAAGSVRITMPERWQSRSNGRLTDRRVEDGVVVDTWVSLEPLARSFVAGPYEVTRHRVENLEVGVYLLEPKPTSAESQARTLARALAALEERWGPYPYGSYGIVEIPEEVVPFYASSEQGFIMAKTEAFAVEGGNLPLFAHEAAHGWWGNRVQTTGPGSLLCSESLAQYGAVVAIESLEGVAAATEFLRFSREGYSSFQCAFGYFEIWRRGGDRPLAELDGGEWDHNLSDSKGHWVYHMLRGRVGDEIFFGTLRRILNERAGEAITLDEVRRAFVAAAPEAEIERFFAEWLDRPGAPILETSWRPSRTSDGADLMIRQVQPGEPYHLDLEFDVYAAGGREPERHAVALAGRQTIVTLEALPIAAIERVELDPEHRHLLWRPEYGSRPTE